MPIGTCDPASRGDAFNITETAEGGGDILITIRWGWDGVSTRETGCDGPIQDIRVRNVSTITYYAQLPNKRRGDKWVAIPPATDSTISGPGQLRNLGLENYSDILGVRLSTSTTNLMG